jgi:hypothetical protein
MNINYKINADGYLTRAIINIARFIKEEDIKFAFYAALELRNCIERVLFEYLIILKDSGLSKHDINSYKPQDLINKINEVEPNVEIKFKFIELILKKRVNQEHYVVIPDFNKLNELYGKLGNFLHAGKKPEKTSSRIEWYEKLTYLVLESKEYLLQILSGERASISKPSPEFTRLYEQYSKSYPNISLELENKIERIIKEEINQEGP